MSTPKSLRASPLHLIDDTKGNESNIVTESPHRDNKSSQEFVNIPNLGANIVEIKLENNSSGESKSIVTYQGNTKLNIDHADKTPDSASNKYAISEVEISQPSTCLDEDSDLKSNQDAISKEEASQPSERGKTTPVSGASREKNRSSPIIGDFSSISVDLKHTNAEPDNSRFIIPDFSSDDDELEHESIRLSIPPTEKTEAMVTQSNSACATPLFPRTENASEYVLASNILHNHENEQKNSSYETKDNLFLFSQRQANNPLDSQNYEKSIPQESYKEKVVAFYKIHNSTKLENVPNLLEKYKGREELLLSKLKSKYGVAPGNGKLEKDQAIESSTFPPQLPVKKSSPAFNIQPNIQEMANHSVRNLKPNIMSPKPKTTEKQPFYFTFSESLKHMASQPGNPQELRSYLANKTTNSLHLSSRYSDSKVAQFQNLSDEQYQMELQKLNSIVQQHQDQIVELQRKIAVIEKQYENKKLMKPKIPPSTLSPPNLAKMNDSNQKHRNHGQKRPDEKSLGFALGNEKSMARNNTNLLDSTNLRDGDNSMPAQEESSNDSCNRQNGGHVSSSLLM